MKIDTLGLLVGVLCAVPVAAIVWVVEKRWPTPQIRNTTKKQRYGHVRQ